MTHKEVTFVVFCPDPRFIESHWDFIRNHLGLEPDGYSPLPRYGGASVLANPDKMESQFTSLMEEIRFYLESHSRTNYKLILFNHEDCKRTNADEDQSLADLKEATRNAQTFLADFEGEIVLFYGYMCIPGDHLLKFEHIVFEDIPLEQQTIASI